MTLTATGATIDGINGAVHMANDTVYVDSIAGRAKGPVRVRGTLAVGDWREPSFNLFLTSSGAELLNNDRGRSSRRRRARAHRAVPIGVSERRRDGHAGRGVRAGADRATCDRRRRSGAVQRARHGDRVAIASCSRRSRRCSRTCASTSTLSIRHNTWVRNREANVEVYTDDPVLDSRRAAGVRADRRGDDGSRRVQLPQQAIPDQTRLGDVHRQSGSQSDAADHRRVRGLSSRRAARSTSEC